MSTPGDQEAPVVKDLNGQHPVPTAWRQTLEEIVRAFAADDYELKQAVPRVETIPANVVRQARSSVEEYGETLIELPPQAWESSASQWMEDYWEVLVDLWTAESGDSDLALSVRVFENGDDYRFQVQGLYVP